MKAINGWQAGLAVLLALLPLLVGAARAEVKPAEPLISPDEMLSVDQIHPGMKGYGKSVFQGTRIERFNVTVLGVLRKMDYNGDMILIHVDDGPPVTTGAGVSAGMSGSPIYVDGKLIGALAFAWPFAKDPVAGVTPIAQMLEVYQPGSAPRPRAVARTGDLAPRDGPVTLDGQLFARARVVPERGLAPAGGSGSTLYLAPVATPVMCSGMGRSGVDALQKTLGRYSTVVMQGPGAPDLPAAEHPRIEPGSAVGVQLLGGDVDSTAIGTVTYVKGDHVLAFGHPMFGLGTIDMPMTTAYIHGVISSHEVSFKMGASIDTVGHITQDRNWSIGGRMGQPARSVEAQFIVNDADRGVHRDYHVRAAVQRDLTPALIYGSLISAVNSVSPPQFGTTRGTVEVWPHGMQPIRKENLFAQSEKPSALEQLFGDPFASMPLAELLQILNTLEVNSFGPVPVDRIRVTVDLTEKRNTATIERAYSDRKRVHPGDTVKLGVVIQPADGPKRTEEMELKIPGNIPAGKLQIGVAGGSSAERLRQMMLIMRPPARSLAQLLQQFAEREPNNDLTVEIAQPVAGISVSGYEFPNLPNVVVEVLTGTNASGVRMTRSHSKQTRSTPWVLSGAALLSLDVEADEKDKSGPLPAALPAFGGGGMSSILDLFKLGAGTDAGGLLAGGDDDGSAAGGDAATGSGPGNLLRLAAGAAKSRRAPEADAPNDAATPTYAELKQLLAGESDGSASGGAEGGEVTVAKPGIARAPGIWKMTTATDLQNGKLDGTLISSRGELALAPKATPLLASPDRFFWAHTADRSGTVYVGGWLNGEITRISAGGATSTLYNTAPDVAVTALAGDGSGTVYAASEPSGSVHRILADGSARVLCRLPGERVWALGVSGSDLYAATGSEGHLYRIARDGRAELVFTAPDRHIMALAFDGKGSLYCGTYPRGKIFRVRDGSVSPVYEVPGLTVTALAADPHGNLYVGTSPRATVLKIDPSGATTTLFQSREKHVLSLLVDAEGGIVAGVGGPARVYRIAPDKTVNTLWDPRAADVLSLTRDGMGNLYAATAGPTQVVMLGAQPSEEGTYTSPVLDAKAVSRWGALRWDGTPQGVEIQTRSGSTSYPDATWSGWSNPYTRPAGEGVTSPAGQYLQYRVKLRRTAGQPVPVVRNLEIFYRTRNRPPEVKLEAPVAGTVLSGTRAIRWTARDPDGDRLTYDIYAAKEGSNHWFRIGTRTGATQGDEGSSAPEETLTPESARSRTAGTGVRLAARSARVVPPGRREAAAMPRAAASGAARLRATKARPAAAAVKSSLPPAGAARAESSTPDSPAVSVDEGQEGSGSINWNTRGTPDGRYRVKIVASDVLTSPDEPATVEVLSEVVQVVNTPPIIQVQKAHRVGPQPPDEVPVMAAASYVASAEYRVDAGEWIGAAAGDGIFDSPAETIRIDRARLKPGRHTLELRARDGAGNEATAKIPYVLPPAAAVTPAPARK